MVHEDKNTPAECLFVLASEKTQDENNNRRRSEHSCWRDGKGAHKTEAHTVFANSFLKG